MPWCHRCGTSLSQHELADSYAELTHPSVFLRLPLERGGAAEDAGGAAKEEAGAAEEEAGAAEEEAGAAEEEAGAAEEEAGAAPEAGEALAVWTTTPWTLPANVAVAVDPGAQYVLVRTGCARTATWR